MKKSRLPILLILLIVSFSLFIVSFFHIDPDYLWHIKAGEVFYNEGLFKTDIFSWVVNGKYWVCHEWLFEIFIYLLKLLFGKYHIFIYSFSFICLLLILLYVFNKKNYLKNIPFTFVWLLFSLILIPNVQIRPQLISNIFLLMTIYFCLDNYNNVNSRKIYFLPLISILWANVHGGSSVFSYLFPFIFLICGLFEFKYNKIYSKKISLVQIKRYCIVIILCLIGICINIHGVRMLVYPFSNMLDNTMILNISEWRNTSLNDFSHYPYFLLLIFVLFIFIFSKKKIRFIDFILFLICVYFGLKSIRFWFYTYIIMSFVIFNYINDRANDKGVELCVIILSCILFILFLTHSNDILNPKYSCYLDGRDIEFIKSLNISRGYNMYDFGGDLIYNDIPVFIDGRADLYTKYNYKDYISISKAEGNYVKLIDKYNFDYFLVSKDYSISRYLSYSDGYSLIYKNNDFQIYKKV